MKVNTIHSFLGGLIILTSFAPSIKKNEIIYSENKPQAWDLVWEQEGEGCSNHPSDKGGLTCMGITQEVWSEAIAKNIIPKNISINVKDAYSQNPKKFKELAQTIYEQMYEPACKGLLPLVKNLCLPTAINFGTEVIPKRIAAIDSSKTEKDQAQQWIKLNLEHYQRIAAADPSQRKFLEGGWGKNIKKQQEYIEKF